MLTLIESNDEVRVKTRPTVAILRRFSYRSYIDTEHEKVRDDLLLMASTREIEKEFGLSINFAAMPENKTHAVLDSKNHCFRLANSDQLLPLAATQSELEEIGEAEQILLIAGLRVQDEDADTRKACLQTIRRIRQNRPVVYAQFLCWERVRSEQAAQRIA